MRIPFRRRALTVAASLVALAISAPHASAQQATTTAAGA